MTVRKKCNWCYEDRPCGCILSMVRNILDRIEDMEYRLKRSTALPIEIDMRLENVERQLLIINGAINNATTKL